MAFAQNNLGDVSWNRASYGGGKAEYQKAIGFFENAKQGFTEAGYTMPSLSPSTLLAHRALSFGRLYRPYMSCHRNPLPGTAEG
ncbi:MULTISPECIES: hypothetical protein [Mesorhizobium]|uniref:Uncharacterized protein n=1 Tax=Mesorhizobium ciceri TaxID=39645 RepID=A0AB38T461_9HYPH|nr:MULTISPECIES: hypothetical protein [Mesorhizobium]MDF3213069.1 hypothetical protein [Mesorhizobium ciceri]RUX70655.1 hypothetical protein EN990_31115 [Mesorhizobium sp. M7A.F.Ca.US.005.03.1.1]RVA12059.1 hypothetical protein EN932_13600 [Mesorhizobium sp. M7A.F.Ca.US.002.01.1.1]UTU49488.1 hypothetical protein LRP29_18480 [Mesorhizobium ciceri]